MIAVFSGTGNSLAVARHLAGQLGDNIAVLPDPHAFDAPHKRIIWVFPVYSWGLPPVVLDAIAALPEAVAAAGRHFAVMTCGDDVGRADRVWRRAVERRGGSTCGVWSVQMPNTYVNMSGFDVDAPEVEHAKLRAMPARVNQIAGQIIDAPDTVDVVRGSWPRIKTGIIYPWFKRYAMSPKPFRALDTCVGCGKCAAACPLHNIQMADRRPRWADHCTMCLRCYHTCPHHAIAYGKATLNKGQYHCPL